MAYLDDKIEQAYKLSNEALNSPRFDTEAFIVASLLRIMDARVPSEEHSCLDKLFDDFCNNRSLDNLELLLNQISRLLCELYHSCETEEEKKLFKDNLLVCRADL